MSSNLDRRSLLSESELATDVGDVDNTRTHDLSDVDIDTNDDSSLNNDNNNASTSNSRSNNYNVNVSINTAAVSSSSSTLPSPPTVPDVNSTEISQSLCPSLFLTDNGLLEHRVPYNCCFTNSHFYPVKHIRRIRIGRRKELLEALKGFCSLLFALFWMIFGPNITHALTGDVQSITSGSGCSPDDPYATCAPAPDTSVFNFKYNKASVENIIPSYILSILTFALFAKKIVKFIQQIYNFIAPACVAYYAVVIDFVGVATPSLLIDFQQCGLTDDSEKIVDRLIELRAQAKGHTITEIPLQDNTVYSPIQQGGCCFSKFHVVLTNHHIRTSLQVAQERTMDVLFLDDVGVCDVVAGNTSSAVGYMLILFALAMVVLGILSVVPWFVATALSLFFLIAGIVGLSVVTSYWVCFSSISNPLANYLDYGETVDVRFSLRCTIDAARSIACATGALSQN